MTVYTLKDNYENATRGHFFDKETLKFFGESLSKMTVLKKTVNVETFSGEIHECYVLSKLGKSYSGKPRRTYAYFDVKTFHEVLPKF